MLFHKRFGGLSYGFRDEFMMLGVISQWRSLLELFIRYLFSVCRVLFAFLRRFMSSFFVFFQYQINYKKTMYIKCPESSIFQDLLNSDRNLNIFLKIMICKQGSWTVLLSIFLDKISTPVTLPNHNVLMPSERKIRYLIL